MLLGMGSGMNRHEDAVLIELWRYWGEQVEAYWQSHYGHESFGAECARKEGWFSDAD